MNRRTLEELYADAARSFIAFARKIDDEDWSRPVPCAPRWSVRDVLSHVAGVADDLVAGRTGDLGSEAWTAVQVQRHGPTSEEALLAHWEDLIDEAVEVLAESEGGWATLDCHCHEHDLRHALDLRGNRENEIVRIGAVHFVTGLEVPFPVRIEMDGVVVTNDHPEFGRYPHEEVMLLGSSHFEVLRSRLGRRTRAQIEEYPWRGLPERITHLLDEWSLLGPSVVAIHE